MRDLERTLRAAAPPPSRAPADLEDRIWAALDNDVTIPVEWSSAELLVDDSPPSRRPSRLGLAIGIAAAAAVLVAAVVVAGLRNGSTRPAVAPSPTATTPVSTTTTTPDPATRIGAIYRESSCPDVDRGACFDPFPPGRYTFHKSNPQITFTVGDGWRNDQAWPWETALSRPDTPGALLDVLMNAHATSSGDCTFSDAGAVGAAALAARLAANPYLVTTSPGRAHLGELDGYVVDVAPRPDGTNVSCSDGVMGVPLMMAPNVPPTTGTGGWTFMLEPGQRARITLADSSLGRVVVAATIVTGDQAALTSFLLQSAAVSDSLTFRPCAHDFAYFQPCEFDPQKRSP